MMMTMTTTATATRHVCAPSKRSRVCTRPSQTAANVTATTSKSTAQRARPLRLQTRAQRTPAPTMPPNRVAAVPRLLTTASASYAMTRFRLSLRGRRPRPTRQALAAHTNAPNPPNPLLQALPVASAAKSPTLPCPTRSIGQDPAQIIQPHPSHCLHLICNSMSE